MSNETTTLCHLVLDRPKIAGNLGSIVRLAANIDAVVHICGETPFEQGSRKKMWRSGLDYWQHANVFFHDDLERCLALLSGQIVFVEVDGGDSFFDGHFDRGAIFVFGPEDGSVDWKSLGGQRERVFYLPRKNGVRCINLAQCVAVVGYDMVRRHG